MKASIVDVLGNYKLTMRLLGLLFYDENGRMDKWYCVSLLALGTEIIACIYCYPFVVFSSSRSNYFTSRPFHSIVYVMMALASIVSRVSLVVRFRFPLTCGDITCIETFFPDDIDYPVSTFDFFLVYIPCVDIIMNGITMATLFVNQVFTPFEMLTLTLASNIPRLTSSFNLMHCWINIEMFRAQAHAIRRSKADRHILATLHSHLNGCCIALHDFYRYQVATEFLKTTMGLLWGTMYLHERILGIYEGKTFSSMFIHPLLNIATFMAQLYYFTSAYQGLKDEVDGFVFDTYAMLMNQKKRSPDRVLSTYVSLYSNMNLSMSGFFVPTRTLIISVLSSTCLYYMLMVQMGILRSSFF